MRKDRLHRADEPRDRPRTPNHPETVAFAAFLLACVLGLSVFVTPSAGRLVALVGLLAFLAVVLLYRWRPEQRRLDLSLRTHPAIVVPTLVLWAVFVLTLLRNPTPAAFVHTAAFVVFSGVALFVVPGVVSRERAFVVIALLGAFGFLTSVPTVLWGNFTLLGYPFDQAGPQRVVLDFAFYPPSSILESRNYLRVLFAFGAVCAAALYVERRRPWAVAVAAMNVTGVALTLGRAASLALLAVAVLLAVYSLAGSEALLGATLLGVVGTLLGVAVAVGLLPGPGATIQAALDERIRDWTLSYRAFAERPVLGWGIVDSHGAAERLYGAGFTGIHSSYIRMFVIGGVVGGLAYVALFVSALTLAYRGVRESAFDGLRGRIREPTALELVYGREAAAPLAVGAYSLVVLVLVFQLFDGATVFGTNLSSVLWALAVGYTQPTSALSELSLHLGVTGERDA
ncbi:O-antigen ligase family protein [Natronorarus salvus]|uniref:O-antigen ligase family protein n=1 Tax=Natronorarus salvus TaxID=3117733 RepID=UPI002F262487